MSTSIQKLSMYSTLSKMKKILSIVFILVWSIVETVAQQYEVTPILVSGDTETMYTLVIVAEGYTQEQLSGFKVDAQKATDMLFQNPTYGSLKDKMNVYAISTPSKESGISLIADNPSPTDPIQVSQPKQTFFNIYYRNSFRAYMIEDSSAIKARTLAHELIPFSDNVLMLANEEGGRGSGVASYFGVAVAVKPAEGLPLFYEYLIRHELGHSIAGLADTYSSHREESFNKTTDKTVARWKSFLTNPSVGIVTIGDGVYCPNPDCIMKTNGNYFCPVCSHRMEQVILGKTKRIETPYRIITKGRTDNSFLLSWDKVKGATGYEVIFNDNSSNGLIPQTIVTDTLAEFQNLNLDAGFGNWIIDIRAFNDTYSTRFASRNRVPNQEFYPILPKPRPTPIVKVSQLSPTCVQISWTKDSSFPVTFLRLYNEQNVLSEITTLKNPIILTGLHPNKKYKLAAATGIIDSEQTNYLSSNFSTLLEFSIDECKLICIPVTVKINRPQN